MFLFKVQMQPFTKVKTKQCPGCLGFIWDKFSNFSSCFADGSVVMDGPE